MESNWVTRNRRTILWSLLAALGVYLLYTVRGNLIGALTPYMYAAVFAYLINPLINRLQRRGIPRLWSSLITVLVIFLLLILLFAVFMPSLIKDLSQMVNTLTGGMGNLRRIVDELTQQLKEWLGSSINMEARLNDFGNTLIKLLTDTLSKLISSLGSLVDVLLVPVITFYFLKDKDLILSGALSLFSPDSRDRMRSLGSDINRLLSGYVQGKLIISAAVGLLTGLGCMLLGLPNALTIGITVGLFDLIPYFGPWLGGLLPFTIALMGQAPIKALWVLVLILVIQQTESNLITPRVISQRVGMHPLVVMFSVIFFGSILGIPGMILGVPLMAVLVALVKYMARRRQAGQEPPPEPADTAIPDPAASEPGHPPQTPGTA